MAIMRNISNQQGALFTSHNHYQKEEIEHYEAQFMKLQMTTKSRFPNLKLHMGCELLCAGEYIEDIL